MIGAVVLAAGLSTRMGQLKVLLEWQTGQTVLDHLLTQLIIAAIDPSDVVVVTGRQAEQVGQVVKPYGAQPVFNPDYAIGEMLSSLKVGLKALPSNIAAALIVLGDQPSIQATVIQQVMQAYADSTHEMKAIVAPSYNMRRGHPILIDRRLWGEIAALNDGQSLRDVMNAHAKEIIYANVDNDCVLRDMDTPEQYQLERQRAGLI